MTEEDPLVSVVITNRDYGRFVGDAVTSALAQTGAETIVVDDGSTDDSIARLAPFEGRIRLLHTDGRGQAAAMNAGVEAARGGIVVFLDADDRLAPDLCERVRPVFAGDPTVARVHFPLRRIDVRGAPSGGTVPPVPSAMPHGDLRRAVAAHPDDLAWQPTSGNAYRRSVLDRVLPIPEADYRISADHWLNALTALHGPVRRLEEIGGDYRIHGSNADARTGFDLARVQAILARSQVTQRAVVEHAARLGIPAGPPGRSVSFQANRMVSLRLGPADHPVAGDRRSRAMRDGVRACVTRSDLPLARRCGAMGLLGVLATVPSRRAVRALARRFVTGSTDLPSTSTTGGA